MHMLVRISWNCLSYTKILCMKADLPYWWKFREIVYSTRKSFARKLTISYNDKNFVNLPKKLQFSQIYLICKVTNWEVYGVFLASQNYGKIKKKMGSVYFPNFQKWMINKWSVYGVRVSVGPCIFLIPFYEQLFTLEHYDTFHFLVPSFTFTNMWVKRNVS